MMATGVGLCLTACAPLRVPSTPARPPDGTGSENSVASDLPPPRAADKSCDFRIPRPSVRDFVEQVVRRFGNSKNEARSSNASDLTLSQRTQDGDAGDVTTDIIHIEGRSLRAASLRWAPVSVERLDLLRASLTHDLPVPYQMALYVERVDAWSEHSRRPAAPGAGAPLEWVERTTSVVIPIHLADEPDLKCYETARAVADSDYSEPPIAPLPEDVRWAIYPEPGEGSAAEDTPAPAAIPAVPAPGKPPEPKARHGGPHGAHRERPPGLPQPTLGADIAEEKGWKSIILEPRSTNPGPA